MWLHLDLIAGVLGHVKGKIQAPTSLGLVVSNSLFFGIGIFSKATYAYTTIPTYPSGQIGFIIASNSADIDLTTSKRPVLEEMKLQYYTPDIHKAAFVLPAFAKAKLNV